MSIIKATPLLPGDVLLEPGDPKIAAGAEGGVFGHASLAVTRLTWMQVGLRAIMLQARPIARYRSGSETFIGFEIDGQALVRRRHAPRTATDVWAEVTSELGRKYASRVKLQQIKDLMPDAIEALAQPLDYVPETDDPLAPGRLCSEACAVVLGLSETLISPGALALTDELMDPPGLVVPHATFIEAHPRSDELAELVNTISRRAAPRLSRALQDCAERLKAGEDIDRDAFFASIEAEFTDTVGANSQLVRQIEALEALILDA
ncbi:hypothetical protein [Caulobacter sp.]|uniref:hypothetical protein n=1 Tax=Caulobacter sp. TaxID=78 RepID=UPI0031DEDA83